METSYYTYFDDLEIVLDNVLPINVPPHYDFFAIPSTHLEQNSKLEQTFGWEGGTFDPLE